MCVNVGEREHFILYVGLWTCYDSGLYYLFITLNIAWCCQYIYIFFNYKHSKTSPATLREYNYIAVLNHRRILYTNVKYHGILYNGNIFYRQIEIICCRTIFILNSSYLTFLLFLYVGIIGLCQFSQNDKIKWHRKYIFESTW